ncbi:type II toxin-antitoxin system RelE family toxin, partial [Porphyromonas levii]|uniref:type II toxin-antitoxin system RelE family toxin n=1 Tax=Porphyromonas levii TaxID=28114 RepID=UPI001B8D9D49
MKVDYSKTFIKQAMKLDKVTKSLLQKSVTETKEASSLSETGNCIKMSGYKSVSRIRISDHRAIFVHVDDEAIFFEYIVTRGQAYDKEVHPTFRVIRQSCRAKSLSLK